MNVPYHDLFSLFDFSLDDKFTVTVFVHHEFVAKQQHFFDV